MSKYTPFINYLSSVRSKRIHLTFSEIESILDNKLPRSARAYSAWWANDFSGAHIWAYDWCRAGWRSRELNKEQETVIFEYVGDFLQPDSEAAIEGYLFDRKVLMRSRNLKLAEARKQKDNSTCQACGFSMRIGERVVIDVHHINPLSISNATVTSLEDLVCLCPTCHRIAHLRKDPLDIQEIKALIKEI